MTIRRKFLAYLLLLHIAFAVILTIAAWDNRIWLIGIEAVFLISFLIALRLFRLLFRPLEILASGAEIMKEKDFTTRFRPHAPARTAFLPRESSHRLARRHYHARL